MIFFIIYICIIIMVCNLIEKNMVFVNAVCIILYLKNFLFETRCNENCTTPLNTRSVYRISVQPLFFNSCFDVLNRVRMQIVQRQCWVYQRRWPVCSVDPLYVQGIICSRRSTRVKLLLRGLIGRKHLTISLHTICVCVLCLCTCDLRFRTARNLST